MKRTTVVIPNYNGMKYIKACLDSLMNQTSKDYQILVVDNGSTDGSREWIREQYPQIEVEVFAENKGFCKAVNVGMKKAGGKYVILLNNDTEVAPDFVEQLESVMERHPNCFSAAAKMLQMHQPELLDGAGDSYCALGWAYARGKGKRADTYQKEERIFSACGGAAIYRKDLLEKIGYLDENHFAYLEDLDLGYRANLYGYQNWYAPKAVVKHVGSGFSGSRYNEFKISRSSKNSIYLIYKNMPLFQILLNLPFLLVGYLVKTLFFMKKGFGMTYLKGLLAGWKLCCSQSAKAHKVTFRIIHLKNYVKIQGNLWWNCISRI